MPYLLFLLCSFLMCFHAEANIDDAEAERLYNLGVQAFQKSDTETAIEHWVAAAKLGHGKSMYKIGVRLVLSGDNKEALRWYHMAAESGYIEAHYKLGVWYSSDLFGEVDESLALKWYHSAAENEYPDALLALGRIHETGELGVSKDEATAADWYTRAAEAGQIQAQEKLGAVYENGYLGREKEYAEAVKWYTMAGEQDDLQASNAQFKLGMIYEHGLLGVEPSQETALKWYTKAAENYHDQAKGKLRELKRTNWLEILFFIDLILGVSLWEYIMFQRKHTPYPYVQGFAMFSMIQWLAVGIGSVSILGWKLGLVAFLLSVTILQYPCHFTLGFLWNRLASKEYLLPTAIFSINVWILMALCLINLIV